MRHAKNLVLLMVVGAVAALMISCQQQGAKRETTSGVQGKMDGGDGDAPGDDGGATDAGGDDGDADSDGTDTGETDGGGTDTGETDSGGTDAGADDGGPAVDLEFVLPAAAKESPTAGNYDFEFSFENMDQTWRWSLMFTLSKNSIDGTEIVSDMPVTETTYSWDTSSLSNGEYFFVLKATNGTSTKYETSEGSVEITGATNTNPLVTLDSPWKEGAFTRLDTVQTIAYTSEDTDGDALDIKVEYSADDGVTWSSVCDQSGVALTAPLASGCSWDPPDGAAYDFKVRVTVDDTKGTPVTDVSTGRFGIKDRDYTYSGDLKPTAGVFNSCLGSGCHENGGANAVLEFDGAFTCDSGKGPCDVIEQIIAQAVDSDNMPDGGPPLTEAQRAAIMLWYWDGAQAN